MELTIVPIKNPQSLNMILGMSHFIKTVEDVHEAMVNTVPGAKFGLAFCEASDACLIRTSGTDPDLVQLAAENAQALSCGHSFILFMRDMYPINVVNTIQNVPEVVRLFCASANPVQAIVAQTDQGRGILGVVDGFASKGVETDEDKAKRSKLLRMIGYKF
ncbi:adenosine-specific kinase [Desulfomicrobium escambiense]|uniref:adenosine-specific kinase n=1 Tax=Desulfomicrobium escambiense TaxID=29503 RepID=UPI00041A1D2D|nr:adenosine-specific kinase [Desulfomicrobium escambiense]